VLTFATRTEAEHYVIALNLKRRHLNTQQKREYIKVQIRKYPALKPRALGKICQVSHMTVVSVMEEMRNPPDKKNYAKAEELLDELKKLIVGLSPKYQRDFAEEYGPWFRDVLEI